MQDRIGENQQKQDLIEELNEYVRSSIQEILDEEQAFYESDSRDRLKVAPYTYVKRIPRQKDERKNEPKMTEDAGYGSEEDHEEIALSDEE
jgi:hypothetical protein